jgi:hypothetical protein
MNDIKDYVIIMDDYMKNIKDYKIIYEGEDVPKRIDAPYVEIEKDDTGIEDFSIFGIDEYAYYETFGQVLRNLSDDKIYRIDDICTFTNLKTFINVYSYKIEGNVICLTENFIETPVEEINDSKTMNVSIFFKINSTGYPDILLIVKEVDLG